MLVNEINMDDQDKTYDVLLTYDLDSHQGEVKQELMNDYEFKDTFMAFYGSERKFKTFHLPMSTLCCRNTTFDDVWAIFSRVCDKVGAKPLRYIATYFHPWSCLPGEPIG